MPLKFKPATFPDEGLLQPVGERSVRSPTGRRDPRETETGNNDESTLKIGMIVVTPHCASAKG